MNGQKGQWTKPCYLQLIQLITNKHKWIWQEHCCNCLPCTSPGFGAVASFWTSSFVNTSSSKLVSFHNLPRVGQKTADVVTVKDGCLSQDMDASHSLSLLLLSRFNEMGAWPGHIVAKTCKRMYCIYICGCAIPLSIDYRIYCVTD